MTIKMVDIETQLCPICQNIVNLDILRKAKLNVKDLALIEELLSQNLLMQIIELGKMASRYYSPEALGTEVQVQDSLRKLSEKETELMERQRQMVTDVANATEEKKAKITEEAMKRQQEIASRFQDEIIKLEGDHTHKVENMLTMLHQIQQKIGGVGIGDVRQTTVIRDLKSACLMDEFSEDKAKKGGTDIGAK